MHIFFYTYLLLTGEWQIQRKTKSRGHLVFVFKIFPEFGASFNPRNFSIVRSVHYNNTVHGRNGTKKKYSGILKYSEVEEIYFEENVSFYHNAETC